MDERVTRNALKVSFRILIIGIIFLSIAYIVSGFKFEKINPDYGKINKVEYSFDPINVSVLRVNTTNHDIVISQSNNNKIKVSYDQITGEDFTTVLDTENILDIKINDAQIIPNNPFEFEKRTINLSIPYTFNGEILLTTVNGSIDYSNENISSKVEIFSAAGKIHILDSSFQNDVVVSGGSASISIENISMTALLRVLSKNGSAELKNIDSTSSIEMTMGSGRTNATSINAKSLEFSSTNTLVNIYTSTFTEDLSIINSTADVNVENSKIGSDLVVQTTTGNQSYENVNSLRYDLQSTFGKIEGRFLARSTEYNVQAKTNGEIIIPETSGFNAFNVNSNFGDISIRFSELVNP